MCLIISFRVNSVSSNSYLLQGLFNKSANVSQNSTVPKYSDPLLPFFEAQLLRRDTQSNPNNMSKELFSQPTSMHLLNQASSTDPSGEENQMQNNPSLSYTAINTDERLKQVTIANGESTIPDITCTSQESYSAAQSTYFENSELKSNDILQTAKQVQPSHDIESVTLLQDEVSRLRQSLLQSENQCNALSSQNSKLSQHLYRSQLKENSNGELMKQMHTKIESQEATIEYSRSVEISLQQQNQARYYQ